MGLHKIKSDTPTMKYKKMRDDHEGFQPISFSSVTSLEINNQSRT